MSPNLVLPSKLPAKITPKQLETIFAEACNQLSWQPSGDIELNFVTQSASQQLNQEYAGNDYATDVLSFDYSHSSEPDGVPKLAGQIAICLPIAQKQADQYNSSLDSEIYLLFIHGLIHLSGGDHQDEADQARFDTLQSDIMKKLNLQYRTMPWSH